VLAIYLFWLRRTQDFYWNDFWYALPVFGKLRKAIRAKDLHPVQDEVTGQNSTAAEAELLATYFNHIGVVTRERFQRAYGFLLLAKQADRRPMPVWGMPFLFILLVAEALGFGLLLAPFVASEITPNSAQIIGFVIALVMAIIAAGLTHAAGQEIYETGLIRKMRKVANDTKSPLYKTAIANDEDQNADLGEADVTRFGNRILESVEDRGSIKFIIVASIFVLIVLGASTVLRYENLRLAVTQQSALAGPATGAIAPAGSSGNPFASVTNPTLPPDVTQDADAAQARVQAEENYEQILGGTAGIIGLGVIFLFTQVYSTSLGIQWGHIKRRRVEAAFQKGTLGYSSYEDYRRHQLDPRIRRSERRLQQLRSGLFGDSHLAPSTFTFRSWMDAKLGLEAGSEHIVPSRPAPAPARPAPFDAEREAAAVMAMPDPDARRAHLRQRIGNLTPAQVQQLQNAIADQKRRQANEAWINDV
jgi:hypothetical protein